jgi:hypothetical protein
VVLRRSKRISTRTPNDRITIMLSGLTQLFNNIYAFGGDFFSIAINLGL